MSRNQEQSERIQAYILQNVRTHPKDITHRTAQEFGITRQAVLRHIKKLIEKGVLVAHGTTRDRYYELQPLAQKSLEFPLDDSLQEDTIWRNHIAPFLRDVPHNVIEICAYGVTEIINNAIDHSEGTKLLVELKFYPDIIDIWIIDNGIGIFRKLQRELNLEDNIHAILELSKGKLTTDPEHHTGEGIFFTSRAFDHFVIASENLYFSHNEESDDWLLEEQSSIIQGTAVRLQISPSSKRKLFDVFEKYASGEDFGFTKTHVPVALARYGDENLISRSQAKRLLARFDKFREIILDFKGVESIGQSFADEIFRVFQNAHPHIHLVPIRANENVQKMIERAIAKRKETANGN